MILKNKVFKSWFAWMIFSFFVPLPLLANDQNVPFESTNTQLSIQLRGMIYSEEELVKGFPKPKQSPLFWFERKVFPSSNQKLRVERKMYNQANQLVIQETMQYAKGRLTQMTWEQKQIRQKARIHIHENQVHFEFTDEEGEVSTNQIPLENEMIVNDQLGPWVENHFSKLLKGEAGLFKLVLPFRSDALEFQIQKEKTTEILVQGKPKKVVQLLMEPSNFIFRIFAPSFIFYADPETRKIIAFRGQMNPKRKNKDGVFEDFKGYMEVEFKD